MYNQNEMLFPYLNMGGAFIMGLSIGMALKKSFKILLILLGGGLIFVFLLNSKGAVQINQTNLENTITIGIDAFQSIVTLLKNKLEEYKSSSLFSALAGFYIGIKTA